MIRPATISDLPAIAEFLANTQYFIAIDPSTLGGNWLIVERDGNIEATLWFFREVPHAFVDYWAAKHPRQALALGYAAEAYFKAMGIKYVHAMIHVSNSVALRLAGTGFDMIGAGDYIRVYKELDYDGQHESRRKSNNTGSDSTGAPMDAIAVATG